MALPAATVWEVRPATGSDSNGGGFVAGASGTDRSQQDSAQISYTDLVIDASDAKKLTSAGHPFTSAEVGNLIQVTSGSGFTTGFYQIVSVAANVATCDRNVGTTSSTGGNAALGGALATVSTAVASLVNSNKVYIKGTYTVSSGQTLSGVITTGDAGPTIFEGYSAARGDGTRATWTTSTNSIDLITFGGAALGYRFNNIEFSSSAGTPGHGLRANGSTNASAITLDNCLVHGFNQGINGDWTIAWSFNTIALYRCRIYSCTSHGIINAGHVIALGCYIHDNGGDGAKFVTGGGGLDGLSLFWRCVIKSNTGKGINYAAGANFSAHVQSNFPIVLESSIMDNGGDDITINPGADLGGLILLNSILDGAGAYGVNFNQTGVLALDGSVAWHNNATADQTGFPKSPSDVTLTGDPFTARGSDDFTLNGTAGAGGACKGIGQPTTFPP